jgi:hypothetical protein
MQNFKELIVYQESFALANELIAILDGIPGKYRLKEQAFIWLCDLSACELSRIRCPGA